MANPNVVKFDNSLDPLIGLRWAGLVALARTKPRQDAVVQELMEWAKQALPLGTFVQGKLNGFHVGHVVGYHVAGNKQLPILVMDVRLYNDEMITGTLDLFENAIYDQDVQHAFPVFVHQRTYVTREAIALEYLYQSPVRGELVESVCTDVAAWMKTLYERRVYTSLDDHIHMLIQRIAAHPERDNPQHKPNLDYLNEACQWIIQADREYQALFEWELSRFKKAE